MDTPRLKTLSRIINETLLESNIDKSQYNRVLSFAIKGIREINLFYNGSTMQCAKLVTDNNHMVNLPSDYLQFVAIGIPRNGELETFTLDNKLIRTTTQINGVQSLDITQGEGIVKKDGCEWGYGATGGHNDYVYCIDLNLGKIIINSNHLINHETNLPINKEIQLWYVSSGISISGQTLVSQIVSDALIAYVLYHYTLRGEFKVKGDMVKIDRLKADYDKEISKIKFLRDFKPASEWESFFCSLFHQSPGR
jgi:hypothetical protein